MLSARVTSRVATIGAGERSLACRRCGAAVERRAKFCGACGAGLRSAERRDVTLVLTDICRFTALAEHLDPEQVREILDAAFAVMLEATHRFGGTVNQFVGDGIIAVFDGTAGAHEHAARAVAAALAMQSGLAPLAESVGRSHGVEFRVRIGVHTGPVTVGAIGTGLRDDYVAMGETTNAALALLRLASGDGVVVSARTRAVLGDRFDFEELASTRARAASGGAPAFVAGARDYAWQAAS